MSEWREYMLTDITSKIGDGLHGTPKYMEDGDYFFINGNNLVNGKVLLKNDTNKVSKEEALKYSKPLADNSILLSINGTIGSLALYNNEKCMLGKSVCYINTNELVVTKYLYYNFLSKDFQNFLELIATGTTIPNVPLKGIREYTLKLPPLPEQQAIAEVLSSLDDKIDLLHRNNKTLEQMAETLFRQWFVVEAKEEWENCKIEALCVKINSGGTPSTTDHTYYNGTINWYSTKELSDNFLLESVSKITQDGLENSSAKLFPRGTVLIAIYAAPTVGRLGILSNEAAFNQAACGLIADENTCCKEFLFLYLKSQRNDLNIMASGSAQQNLNVGKIKEYPAFKPDFSTMNKFRLIVEPIFDKIEKNTLQIKQLNQLRDSLLPKLMSGQVRVELK